MKKIKAFLLTNLILLSFATMSCENEIPEAEKTAEVTTKEKYDYSQHMIKFEDKTVTYDGNPQSITITGFALPVWLGVYYEGNNVVDAGTYRIKAHFIDKANKREVPNDMYALLVIEKKTIDETKLVTSAETRYTNKAFDVIGTFRNNQILERDITVDKSYIDVGFYSISLLINSKNYTNAKSSYRMSLHIYEEKVNDGLIFVNVGDGYSVKVDEAYKEKITYLYIPEYWKGAKVTAIEDEGFYHCYSLQTAVLPNSIARIGKSAFHSCTKLTSINIPNNITTIEDSSFSGCTSLTFISFPDAVTKIGDFAFFSCLNLCSFNIPKNVKMIGKFAFEGCKSLKSIYIPDGVSTINDYAFKATGLTSVVIPNSVKNIGKYAFDSMSLISVTLTNSMQFHNFVSVFNSAIKYIKEIVLLSGWYSIPDYIFEGFSSLINIYIPSTVTTIGSNAFNTCTSLMSIVLPNSIKTIGSDIFKGCSSLYYIYYEGSKDDFNAISENLISYSQNIYFYSDEVPLEEGNFWHYINGYPAIW